MFCKKCGAQLSEDTKICTSCNYDFEKNQYATPEVVSVEQPNADPAVVVNSTADAITPVATEVIPAGETEKMNDQTKKSLTTIVIGVVALIAVCVVIFGAMSLFSGGSADGVLYQNEDYEYLYASAFKADIEAVEIFDTKEDESLSTRLTDNNILYTFVTETSDTRTTSTLYYYDLNAKEVEEVEVDDFKSSDTYAYSYIIKTIGDDVLFKAFDELKYYDAKDKTVIDIADSVDAVYKSDADYFFYTEYDDYESTLYHVSKNLEVTEIADEIFDLYMTEFSDNQKDPTIYYHKFEEMYSYNISKGTETLMYEIPYDTDITSSSYTDTGSTEDSSVKTEPYNFSSYIRNQHIYTVSYSQDVAISSMINFDIDTSNILAEPVKPSYDDFTVIEQRYSYFGGYYDYETVDYNAYWDAYDIYDVAYEQYALQQAYINLKDTLDENGYSVSKTYRDIYIDGELVVEKASSVNNIYTAGDLVLKYSIADDSDYTTYRLSEIMDNIGYYSTNVSYIASDIYWYISDQLYYADDTVDESSFLISKTLPQTPLEDIVEDGSISSITIIDDYAYITTIDNESFETLITKFTVEKDGSLSSPVEIFEEGDISFGSIYKNPYASEIYFTYYDHSGTTVLCVLDDDEAVEITDEFYGLYLYKSGDIIVHYDREYIDGFNSFTIGKVVDNSLERIVKNVNSFSLLNDGSYIYLDELSYNSNNNVTGADLIRVSTKGEEFEIADDVISFLPLDANTDYYAY